MRLRNIVLVVLFSGGACAQTPLPHQTPTVKGDVDADITQANVLTTICVHGYTAVERGGKTGGAGPAPTEALKKMVYARDKMKSASRTIKGKKIITCCEVDHLVSLELGGRNSADNLWAQPYKEFYPGNPDAYGAREKDQVEDHLHEAVCKQPDAPGWMSLADAQHAIRTDWIRVYRDIQKSKEKEQ